MFQSGPAFSVSDDDGRILARSWARYDGDRDGKLTPAQLKRFLQDFVGGAGQHEEVVQMIVSDLAQEHQQISPAAFMAYERSLHLSLKDTSSASLRELFDILDGDRDGRIGVQDLLAGSAVPALTKQEAEHMIEQYDADGDGALSWEEWLRTQVDEKQSHGHGRASILRPRGGKPDS
eukprot:tig00001466_g8789.t1